MKIILTGGGSGGHFYPLIAVAEQLRDICQEEGFESPCQLYYMGPPPEDHAALEKHRLHFIRLPAGKLRLYFSWQNITDIPKTLFGILKALWQVFRIYPDVVFSKGGYGSTPVLTAARLFGIPVVIHESDSVPGRSNQWAGRFAARIAVSYPEAAEHFPRNKVAHTGQPVRQNVQEPIQAGSREYFQLPAEPPVLLVLGGSQGARNINSAVVNALPQLLEKYCVIHQTGEKRLQEVTELVTSTLKETELHSRYRAFGQLDDEALARAAGISDLVISRAGSTIFEIARWGRPSIIIPIMHSQGDHQRKNAYAYARTGAAKVIAEDNLGASVLASEIERILGNPARYQEMSQATEQFVYPQAARTIAREISQLAQAHY